MSFHRLAWRARNSARFLVDATGIGKLRVGSHTLEDAARKAWRYILYQHLAQSSSPVRIQGHRMYVGGAEQVLFVLKLAADRFEPTTTRLVTTLLSPGMNVLDAGAHVGYFTLLAARAVGATGRVFAFEAEPYTYKLLVKNVKINGYSNVLAIPQALSDHNGYIELFRSRREETGVAHWNRVYRVVGDENGTAIPTTSIDAFLLSQKNPPINLLKMDIEGAEFLALKGARLLFATPPRPKLILEFYPSGLSSCGSSPHEFLKYLRDHAYKVSIIGDDRLEEVSSQEALILRACREESLNLFCE